MATEKPIKRFMFNRGLKLARIKRELRAAGKEPGFFLIKQYNFFDKVVFKKVRERFGGRLRYAFSGGAALSREVAQFIDDMNIIVYEGYWLTETSPICTANRPRAQRNCSVGKAIPGCRCSSTVPSPARKAKCW
jgi:long-chain acyl-CoA synthetase